MFDYRKFGKPRTEEERKRRHKRLYGKGKVPRRGTGQNGYTEALKKG